MIWKRIVRPRAIAPASARWSAMSGSARKTRLRRSPTSPASFTIWLWIRDIYRPELHYMRGPGPKWRAKQAVSPDGQRQLSPVHIRRRNAANITR
jgi:hypothetical protein